MSRGGLNILAVVPARGGSKGILRKNLKEVCGISLVGRAGKLAKSIDWIDEAIVSTDDVEIAEEARKYGLDVPFMRPADLAGDRSGSVEMWQHAWYEAEKYYKKRFDVSILLEPTSPMRRVEDIDRTVSALLKEDAPAAVTVSKTPAHFTPHKTLTINDTGEIGFYLEGGANFSLRQNIPNYYHRNGLCYALRREHLLEKGFIIDEKALAIVVKRYVVNIDDLFELELAEWLMKKEKQCE